MFVPFGVAICGAMIFVGCSSAAMAEADIYDFGKLDGIVGANTRAAIKAMQIQFGMPADSWPTPELLARLGG